jgi:hypothetical protein
VKMTVVNSALNAIRVHGRMKRQWQNVRPTWYYWNLQKRRKYNEKNNYDIGIIIIANCFNTACRGKSMHMEITSGKKLY